MGERKSPVRHRVRAYTKREGTHVGAYNRGHGQRIPIHKTIPSYLGYGSVQPREYSNYLENSLHGGFVIDRNAEPVSLKLTTVNRDDLDYFTSDRNDFTESVAYWKDQIRNGRTIPPILCHRLPNNKMAILDGQARVQAWHEMGKDFGYPCVENSFMDSLKSFGGKAKEKSSGFLVKAEKVGHEVGSKAASRVAEGFHERAKGLAFDIKEKAAEDRTKLVEGAKGWGRSQIQQGKENLVTLLQSGAVRKLLEQAKSSNIYTSTNAKRILRNRYPEVWANTPWAEKVSHVIHEEVKGRGYAEAQAEAKDALENAKKLAEERAKRKELYLKGGQKFKEADLSIPKVGEKPLPPGKVQIMDRAYDIDENKTKKERAKEFRVAAREKKEQVEPKFHKITDWEQALKLDKPDFDKFAAGVDENGKPLKKNRENR